MPSDSQDDAHPAEQLRAGVRSFVRKFGLLASDATPCGKPISVSHAHALAHLLERREQGPTSQQMLGAALGIDKSNVTRLCARMERLGHIVQRIAPEDGRARHLALTAAGVRLAQAVQRSSLDRFTRLLTSIPASERAGVLAALDVLNQAIDANAPTGKAQGT